MMRKCILAALASVSLAGCGYSNEPSGDPLKVVDVISEISFLPAHTEKHCSKSCSYNDVPDKWFILFCRASGEKICFDRSIEHAPWRWEKEGNRVTITWQPRERYWTILKLEFDGNEVVL